ncbi:MAG: hypothetical protein C4524_05585 [Candidatus Zixiibacteriota bacterium]|nr:MAG: hypothetical protein C4524_05585 [candidate division Zixibacteria bacterium]
MLRLILQIFAGVMWAGGAGAQSLAGITWECGFGGSGTEQGCAIQVTADGGYIIGGWTDSFGAGGADACLVKLDRSGVLVWQAAFGGPLDDYGQSVQQTQDGGYILGGYTQSYGTGDYDMYMIKTDASGNCVWQKTFGGSDYDVCRSVQQTRDGGYILGGDSRSFGFDCDMYLVKTDSRGELEWQAASGDPENDYCLTVQQTPDGGYLQGGDCEVWTGTRRYDWDMCLRKTDDQGRLEWRKTYGGPFNDGCRAVQMTRDGGWILAGDSSPGPGCAFDAFLVKVDSRGQRQWQRTYGSPEWDEAHAVIQTQDGGYLLAGCSEWFGDFDAYLVKTDPAGRPLGESLVGGPDHECAYALLEPVPGAWLVAGGRETGDGSGDLLLAGSQGLMPATCLHPGRSWSDDLAFRGGCKSHGLDSVTFHLPEGCKVWLEVCDVAGRAVQIRQHPPLPSGVWLPAGRHELACDCRHLPSGVYFARLTAGHRTEVQKLVVLR